MTENINRSNTKAFHQRRKKRRKWLMIYVGWSSWIESSLEFRTAEIEKGTKMKSNATNRFLLLWNIWFDGNKQYTVNALWLQRTIKCTPNIFSLNGLYTLDSASIYSSIDMDANKTMHIFAIMSNIWLGKKKHKNSYFDWQQMHSIIELTYNRCNNVDMDAFNLCAPAI